MKATLKYNPSEDSQVYIDTFKDRVGDKAEIDIEELDPVTLKDREQGLVKMVVNPVDSETLKHFNQLKRNLGDDVVDFELDDLSEGKLPDFDTFVEFLK